jgi:nitrate/nitrite transport system substrate-binding protein
VSRPAYINCPKEIILGRLLGKYDHGDGGGEHEDPDYMRFFDRGVNFPWKSHGIWWISQFRRWGMVKGAPDYKKLVDQVHRPDIYREVAKEMGIEAPTEDVKSEKLFDGVAFDPTKPEEYAKSFSANSIMDA